MKQKLLALVTAFALCLGMTGCHLSTPDTVGTVGDVEVTAGIYLISQFQAYQTALGYASTEQSGMAASAFLKQTIYLLEDGTAAPAPAEGEEQTGEAVLVSDFVASETMANLEYYVAVETLFDQLGGELSDDDIAYAEYYSDLLWSNYSEIYEANGIGQKTLTQYQYSSMKNSALLEMIYGVDGTEEVSEDDLTTYLYDALVYASHISVPLYNTADYTFAEESQQTEILTVLENILAETEASVQAGEAGVDAFASAVEAGIGGAYDVMGSSYSLDSLLASDLYTGLYSKDTLAESYDETTLASLNALALNQGTTFVETYTSAKAFFRIDPLESNTIEDLRYDILVEMKGEDLTETLETLGETLTHALDDGAMKSFPASKVVS